MKHNVSIYSYCFGCGVCSSVCPKQIISINLDRSGFYRPLIKENNKCINCEICLDVCSFNYEEISLKTEDRHIKSWAAWSDDDKVRMTCSSGGIGFEIGKQLIEKGYHAVGCRYNITEQRAEHYIATTVDDYLQSIGSKYIQSYTEKAFKQIKRKGQKYLITGTPCQIDSFRRMIRKFKCEDNFVLMDFFCHCVPSMLAWKAYIKMIEPKIGKVTMASWRNKPTGWHDSWTMVLSGDRGDYISWMSKGDYFYKLFLGDICMGKQCEKNCKYKYDKSSADIRIGDMWGNTYRDDEKGVSSLIAFTEKGYGIIQNLENITLIEHPFYVVAEGQMKKNARHKEITPIIMFLLKHNEPLKSPLFALTMFVQRIITKFKRIL